MDNGKKIVVIDDDLAITSLIEALLKDEFDVIVFNDPMEAIKELGNIRPSGVLLDINMPHIDGMEVLKQIKRHPQNYNVPIICFSGESNYEIREKLDEYGALGFIKKPIDAKRLKSNIKSYLDSANKLVQSENKLHQCTITYSVSEKYRLITEKIEQMLSDENKIVFITWRNREEFGSTAFDMAIESDQLIWLEIKSISTIKMPYLTDLTPIIDDIVSLLPQSSEKYHLVFDDLKNLFNLQDRQRTVSKTSEFSRLLRLFFSTTDHYMSQPQLSDEISVVLRMAQLLAGQGA